MSVQLTQINQANALTGMVNLSVETIRTHTITSLLILAAYTATLLAIAWASRGTKLLRI